jgi:cyclase
VRYTHQYALSTSPPRREQTPMRRLSITFLAAVVAPLSWAQDFSAVQITTTELADGIYVMFGAGGNMGLSVGEDGAFLIDDQFAPLSDKIMAAIGGVTDDDVKFLLNTHWHGDHTGGNEAFGDAGAIIVAHDNTRVRMTEEQFREFSNQTYPPSPTAALPIVTFNDEISFHWNGDTIRAFHVAPAHTDGDAILHFEDADIFHMGDTFFNGFYPFIDVYTNGDINGIIAAGYRVLAMSNANSQIIPGHGPMATPDDLRDWLQVIRATRESVQNLIDRGLSEDEVVAARPTAEFDEQYGGGFMNPETYNRLLYQSLSR